MPLSDFIKKALAQAQENAEQTYQTKIPTISTPSQPLQQQPEQQSVPPVVPASHVPKTVSTFLGKGLSVGETVSIPDIERQSGTYILGVQGVGKSSLLEHLIFQDICKGYAVIVLDPYGDLIDHAIAQLPEEKVAKTFIFDIEDIAYPFGLNLFNVALDASIAEQTQAQDRILHVFEKCFPETSRMLLEKYLGNIAPVFFANAQKGYAMTDIPKFLRDDTFRVKLLRNNQVRYFIREFWEDEYSQLSPSQRQSETASLATRLNRFVRSPIVGNIIGQSTTTIDFRKAIENKEIIFIKLPVKTLREDAQLIGTMLIAQIHAAIFSFADTPLEKRPGFSLFVDDFQHFATSDFSEMFTEGRKYGSRVAVAHQYREQLPEYLTKATLTARTIITFQATHEDATKLAHLYKDMQQAQIDIDPDPVYHLMQYGHENAGINNFANYFRALENHQGGSFGKRFKVALNELNHFFYEAERTGDLTLPIPLAIFEPSSYDTLYDFNDLWLSIQNNRKKVDHLCSYQAFNTPEATEQTRTMLKTWWIKERQVESLLTLLLSIRATQRILVQDPIGERIIPSSTEIAAQIVNLPRREALVKIGNQTSAIYTLNTPASLPTAQLGTRKRTIQEQTRKKYCRPAMQVEAEISKRLGLQTEPEPEREERTNGATAAIEPEEPQPTEAPPSYWEEI